MKQLVRGVARRNHKTAARQAMLNKKIRAGVLKKMCKGDKINLFRNGKFCFAKDFSQYYKHFLMGASC